MRIMKYMYARLRKFETYKALPYMGDSVTLVPHKNFYNSLEGTT